MPYDDSVSELYNKYEDFNDALLALICYITLGLPSDRPGIQEAGAVTAGAGQSKPVRSKGKNKAVRIILVSNIGQDCGDAAVMAPDASIRRQRRSGDIVLYLVVQAQQGSSLYLLIIAVQLISKIDKSKF